MWCRSPWTCRENSMMRMLTYVKTMIAYLITWLKIYDLSTKLYSRWAISQHLLDKLAEQFPKTCFGIINVTRLFLFFHQTLFKCRIRCAYWVSDEQILDSFYFDRDSCTESCGSCLTGLTESGTKLEGTSILQIITSHRAGHNMMVCFTRPTEKLAFKDCINVARNWFLCSLFRD